MSLPLVIVLVIVLLLGLASGGYALYLYRSGKTDQIKIKKDSSRNRLYFFYLLFTRTPLIKRYFRKFRMRLEALFPADAIDVNKKATVEMLKALGMGLLAMTAIVIMCAGDIFYMLIGLLTVYVIISNAITKSVEKLELRLLYQFADFLTDCRGNYHTSGMVDDAIYMTLDDIPYEIGLHINRIYDIIIATNISEEVEKYTDIAPNRFLNMFAAVCATIKEFGDKKLENGESLFLKNLEYIKQEVYIEINKQEKNNFLFSGLVFTAVFPVFCMKLISRWAMSISELSDFYNGPIGMIVMVLTFGSSFLCYELISNLKDGRVGEIREHKLMEKVAAIPILSGILTAYTNKHYTKALRTGDDLKMVGDHISPQAFLAKRLIVAIVLMLITAGVIQSAVFMNRNKIAHDFSESFNNSIVVDETYKETMREAAEMALRAHRQLKATPNDIETLSAELQAELNMEPALATEVATEVNNRAVQYRNSYYRWYYILIILAIGALGFYAPLGLLKYQLSIMQMSMDDEVAQFQSLALILMHVDGMTLDVILEWMERFAFAFKQSISECILNLEASEADALERMKEQETFPAFRRFVNNLMNVDEVGVASAFDEVKTEQENYKEQRKLKNEVMMTKKSNIGKDISKIPMAICVVGYLIFPFVQMAFKMMQSIGQTLSF